MCPAGIATGCRSSSRSKKISAGRKKPRSGKSRSAACARITRKNISRSSGRNSNGWEFWATGKIRFVLGVQSTVRILPVAQISQPFEFLPLGVLGDWQNPYRSLDPQYEAVEIRELGKFIAAGSVYRRKKPVYWCASCVTALAEAEVEYEDHTSASIYVKFEVINPQGKFSPGPAGTFFVIWTT